MCAVWQAASLKSPQIHSSIGLGEHTPEGVGLVYVVCLGGAVLADVQMSGGASICGAFRCGDVAELGWEELDGGEYPHRALLKTGTACPYTHA